MTTSLPSPALSNYVARQLDQFFPDGQPVPASMMYEMTAQALARLEPAIAASSNKYFQREGKPFFDHLHSDQYAMFLYLLARIVAKAGLPRAPQLATKLYLLNKALHGLDVYFEVQLPEVFLFAHPVGTVLGRAEYGNYFVVMQNCTVGNIDNRFPKIGEKVVLCSGSAVLGGCDLGAGACVGAGSLLVNVTIPAQRTVTGRGKEICILSEPSEKWRNYFRLDLA